MGKIPLRKKTLNFRDGDWDYLEEKYQAKGLSVSVVIRAIISRHVDALKIGELDLDELLEEITT